MKNRKSGRRRGFTLVELVVVILIIAILILLVFVGGAHMIAKSRMARAESDMHNYSIGATAYLNSNHDILKLKDDSSDGYQGVANGLNEYLGKADYVEITKQPPSAGNICNSDEEFTVYETNKRDPWGNPYCVLFDGVARNKNATEGFITFCSAGPNGKLDVGSTLDKDDIFLLCQYVNGEVLTQFYNMSVDKKDNSGKDLIAGFT